MKDRLGSRIFLYLFVILVLLVTLFPFYWIINMSLQSSIELYDIQAQHQLLCGVGICIDKEPERKTYHQCENDPHHQE